MKTEHVAIVRALVAAQVAFMEYIDEDIAENKAKAALVRCLEYALKLAKKL